MSQVFNYKTLALAIASLGVGMSANAAGLDRSGQDITAFLQDGTYAEAVYTYIDTDVSGYDNGTPSGASTIDGYVQGRPTGNISETYDFGRFGVKADINDRFSVGVIYDEPFGAAVQYEEMSNFTGSPDKITTGLTGQVVAGAVQSVNQRLSKFDEQASALTSFQRRRIAAPIKKSLQTSVTALTAIQQAPSTAAINAYVSKATQELEKLKQVASTLSGDARTFVDTQIKTTEESLARLQATTSIIDGINQDNGGTNVEIRTNNVTALVGAKFGANKNFQIYAGPAAQRLTGEVHLRGSAYQASTGYDARISPDQAMGWVAGVSYSKPEIALKASLTYRSEIEHKTAISETVPVLGLRGMPPSTLRDFKVTLPESYNLDFQTGVNPTTLLTAKVRYVPWSDFAIRPPTYGDVTTFRDGGNQSALPIVSYDKDQWSAEIGLGKRLSERLAVSGSIGYDSGAGDPVSSLGPVEGYYSVGLGAKYNVTPQWSVSVGGKYLKFGDATAHLPTKAVVGKFQDNDGYIAGVKLAYQAK